MAFEEIATLTDIGKYYLINSFITGVAVKIQYFALGSKGHDPDDYTTALAPDVSIDTPVAKVFGIKEIKSAYIQSRFTPVFECVVDRGELQSEVSSLYLLGDVSGSSGYSGYGGYGGYSGYDGGDSRTIVIAIVNFPVKVIIENDKATWLVAIAQ